MAVNVLGFVISNFMTLAFSGLTTEAQWRFPLGIQLIFCVIILIMVPILPESPRWYMARRRDEDARTVLHQLNEGNIEDEFEEIQSSVKAEQAAQSSWSQLLRGGLATRRVLLGMMLQIAQQLSGISKRVKRRTDDSLTLTGARCTGLLYACGLASVSWIASVHRSPRCYRQCSELLADHVRIGLVRR